MVRGGELSLERADPKLVPFLTAADEDAAREALGRLLEEEVSPLVWKVVRRQLGWRSGRPPGPEDLEDVHAGVLFRMSRHLLSLRRDVAAARVLSLADYTAGAAYNACASFHEQRFPLRTRLRYRLRYVLRHDSGLKLWEIGPGETVCGLAHQSDTAPTIDDPALIAEAAGEAAAREGRGNRDLPRSLRRFFALLGGPCSFAALVEAMATALGIDDRAGTTAATAIEQPDRSPSSLERLEARELFARLWAEVGALPRPQRVALLLNLRDGSGQDVLGLLALAGIASIVEMAAVLEVSEGELEALLPTLPRDDAFIAGLLGVTPRQVVNLRKSARARLGRRLRGVLGARW